jgi:AraC-like DNA-binding protein
LQISEIAYLLSYADASAFNRSFKRWTGKTPSEHRQAL